MLKKVLAICVFYFACWPVIATPQNCYSQRALFWQARQAVLNRNYDQFERIKLQLRQYPLYPYLQFLKLSQLIDYEPISSIDHFLKTYCDTPLAVRLRAEYLLHAAKRKKWTRFIHYYRPIYGLPMQCYYATALLATGQTQQAYPLIAKLWLHAQSRPTACQMPFAEWETNEMNYTFLWKKLNRALQQHQLQAIQPLVQLLPYAEKRQFKRWFFVYRNPLLLTYNKLDKHNKIQHTFLKYGLLQLAQRDPKRLLQSGLKWTHASIFTEAEQQQLLKALAISLARRNDSSANVWLAKVKPAYTDEVLREWRVRIALVKGDWPQVLNWIRLMPATEQTRSCWRYWKARALYAMQQKQAGKIIYKNLAKEIDYYGVLASQRLHQAYRPEFQESYTNGHLQDNPAIQRAKELYALGFRNEARREWQWALNDLSYQQLHAAAYLAKQWQWYDLAIIAAAKAHRFNDIKLRFPLAYRSLVLQAARRNHLNSAWIWGIMRQESAFLWNAKSSVGALGLMQLMPQTGNMLARQLQLGQINLLQPAANIRLGSLYLSQLLKQFNRNPLIATAAYNVGPHRIKSYQALFSRLPHDVWVEMLPWKETRNYVKNVTLARHIYYQIQ